MPVEHYENFPVASILLPPKLRRPIEAVYAFARSADDFADEGDLSAAERLDKLNAYSRELDALEAEGVFEGASICASTRTRVMAARRTGALTTGKGSTGRAARAAPPEPVRTGRLAPLAPACPRLPLS